MSFSIHFLTVLMQLIISVESKVCSSVNVRNTPEHISEFKDCRVIQGNLMLVLVENVEDDFAYVNRSFSELYEITDYLIIFKMARLRSLSTIFPKLTSIKGEKLFWGFALILYELHDLNEIGLTNLRTIQRGGVKINRCPNLCYVDTVDWDAIGSSHMQYNDRSANCADEWCPAYCRGNCWNTYQCQIFDKDKCDPSCIGCTKVNSPKDCTLCKYFNDTGTCVQTCPKSKLIDNYLGRCVNSTECISNEGTWSIFGDNCVNKCPRWYDRNSTGHCTPSKVRLCQGIRITNSEELKRMIFCTHINGSLDIALSHYVGTGELEKNLGSVISISASLKVLRSNAITTLEFFKSLRIIKGESLWGQYYSLFVIENPNLQRLFNRNTTLVIEKGEAFFQNNPSLCPSEYKKFKVNVTAYGNGIRTMCKPINLNVTIVTNNATNVTLTWPEFKNKTIIGYTIYYTKLISENFNLVQIKDGFIDEDGWCSTFVLNNTVFLEKLTPYTNYSYYINIHSISESDSAQSRIYSFKTTIGDPSEPLDLEIESRTENSLTLKWKRPRFMNGNLIHYKLAIYELEDDQVLIKQRNYCLHPHVENNYCNCSKQVDVQLFHKEAVCTEFDDYYCNNKTTYYTEGAQTKAKLRIQKRSIDDSEDIKEEIINVTKRENEIYRLSNLKPFTLYMFFLQACNDKEDGENHHCGGSIMGSQRTMKRIGADVVTDVNVTVSNKSVVVSWTKPKYPNSFLLAYKIEYKKENSIISLKQKCQVSDQFDSHKSELKISDLDPGEYKLCVRAVTLAGTGEVGQWYSFRVGAPRKSGTNWLYGSLIVFGVLVVAFLGFIIWRRYRRVCDGDDFTLVNRMMSEEDFEGDEWKLDDETVEIIKELRQNSVGIVYRKKEQ